MQSPTASVTVNNYKTLSEIDSHLRKGTVAWYEAAYSVMKFDPGLDAQVIAATGRGLKLKPEYLFGESHTGVPWAMLLIIHHMECGNNPKGCLHNGEAIVGTGRKTKLVPKGRGPFATFQDTIVDAVNLQGLLNSVKKESWTLGMMLKQTELFNGSGYLRYHPSENSPYIWGCTSINDGTGKYVADGHYDPKANANAQIGAAAILRQLEIMREWSPVYSA
jgi:lysozyme family protein